MASSGTKTTYNGNFYLKIRWDITSQNTSTNRSGLRVRMYLGANSGWSVSDSSNSWTLRIGDFNFSGSNVAVSINGSEKLIADEQVFLDHNSDGSLSVWLDGSVSGFYFGGINHDGFSAVLDSIPRASSTNSSASWTATEDLAIGIQRADSSFTHNIRVYVNNVLVASASDINTAWTFSNSTFHSNVVEQLGTWSSRTSRIEIDTYSGSTKIGDTFSKTGTVTAPSASILSGVPSSINVGTSYPTMTINRANTSLSHKVEVFWGASVVLTTATPGTGTTSVSLGSTDELYDRITTSNTGSVTIRITTYYSNTQNSNTQIRTPVNYAVTMKIVNENPTPPSSLSFTISQGDYSATINSSTAIVQSKSSLSVSFGSSVAGRGASLEGYIIKATGRSDLEVPSHGSFSIGTLNASGNGTIQVQAIDSRGNTATTSVPITIIPWQKPIQSHSIKRDDGFGQATTLTVKGIMSDVKVNGTRTNTISSIRYRVKTAPSTSFGGWTPLGNTGFTYDNNNGFSRSYALNFSETTSHEIEVEIRDAYDGLTLTSETRNLSLSSGKPLLFLETDLLSIGINTFPTLSNTLEVGGSGIKSTALTVTGASTLSTLSTSGLATLNSLNVSGSVNLTGTTSIGYNSANINAHNAGKIAGNLTHSGDYFNIRSYSSTYGAGQAEIWYSDTDNRIRFGSRSDSNGTIRNTQISVNDIEVSNLTIPSGASALTLSGSMEISSGLSLTGLTSTVSAYAFTARNEDNLLIRAGSTTTPTVNFVRRTSSATFINARVNQITYSSGSLGSKISTKDNIEPIENSFDALGVVNENRVWSYHLKRDLEERIYDKKKVGLIYEMASPILRNDEGIEMYSMLSLSWRAIQQLSEKVKEQEKELDDLKLALGVTE